MLQEDLRQEADHDRDSAEVIALALAARKEAERFREKAMRWLT